LDGTAANVDDAVLLEVIAACNGLGAGNSERRSDLYSTIIAKGGGSIPLRAEDAKDRHAIDTNQSVSRDIFKDVENGIVVTGSSQAASLLHGVAAILGTSAALAKMARQHNANKRMTRATYEPRGATGEAAAKAAKAATTMRASLESIFD